MIISMRSIIIVKFVTGFEKQLAEDIINFCSPIREQIIEYAANPDNLDKVAAAGAEKQARASAVATMKEVRKLIGFR